VLGVASRKIQFLPVFIQLYAGDILWAVAVFFILKMLFPEKQLWKLALSAFFFSVIIEISQLYHSHWINNIRSTTLGGLALGFGFHYNDFICYLIGVLIALILVKLYRFYYTEN